MEKTYFKELKEEYNKIIWLSPKNMVKKTTAVVVVSIIMGSLITMSDFIFQHIIGFIVGLF